ncbi:unnamed protein product [Owenia fusiformis]|uniref:Uncharacterized protein n=1 Tax=Owenia fusiformis TaxID=6347 RepID=A0A8J1XGI2_OWEFU|nr:unnamed protein product [Owenia fusiformis]
MAQGGVSFLGDSGGRMADQGIDHSILERLTQQTQLQKMLTDEKLLKERHKANYLELKAEFTRCQDENHTLQGDLGTVMEEMKQMQAKYTSLLEQARKEIADKNNELEEVREQSITPQKIDQLKIKIAEDLEGPFKEKFNKLDQDVEQYRNEYNKLRYEYSFLKSEYEHEQQEFKRITDEMKLQHEAEVTNLRKERETVIGKLQQDTSSDNQKCRVLQRENTQLNLKMKSLLAELEEIRAQREHLGLQSDHVARLQSKQITEHSANLRSLETEKESLKLQCDNLHKELTSSTELNNHLTNKVHELEKENIVLKNRAEEVTHKSKVEVTNVKMDAVKERGDLERHRDQLINECEGLRTQLEILQHSVDQQANALVEKERECVRKVQAAREEEWQKTNKIENEKLEYETKLHELERRRIDEETERHSQQEKMEETMKEAAAAKEAAEKEAVILRSKMADHQSVLEQLKHEQSDTNTLRNRIHQLQTELNNVASSDQQQSEQNQKLKNQIEILTNEVKNSREQLRNNKFENEKTLAQHRAAWEDEKRNYDKRVDELDQQVASQNAKIQDGDTEFKKKKKQYAKMVRKLKDRLQLMDAKTEQLSLERDMLKKGVSQEVYLQMKRKLKDLQKRHMEFRSLLVPQVTQVPIGNMTFASVTMDPSIIQFDQQMEHQQDLDLIKQRLDLMDKSQQQQMDELRGAAGQNMDIGPSVLTSTRNDNIGLSDSDVDQS